MNFKYQITSDESRATRTGFSLTEVLIAVGILAMGMLFIAGSFPVSIHFTTVAAERTIAPAVADEAFAKCRIYLNGLNPKVDLYTDRHKVLAGLPPNEFTYPSTPTTEPYTKKYWWSAIFRGVNLTDVEVTVFVSRKVGASGQYYVGIDPNMPDVFDANRPDVISVPVILNGNDLQFVNLADRDLINDGYTIVDDTTGRIYRVLERYGPNLNLLRLDQAWQGTPSKVWVSSSPVNSSRYPGIGVYQKIMRF